MLVWDQETRTNKKKKRILFCILRRGSKVIKELWKKKYGSIDNKTIVIQKRVVLFKRRTLEKKIPMLNKQLNNRRQIEKDKVIYIYLIKRKLVECCCCFVYINKQTNKHKKISCKLFKLKESILLEYKKVCKKGIKQMKHEKDIYKILKWKK